MALMLYAATLFVSAFLLFLVQPMIGKMILPKLGGTPQVWNTCMLFFQTALLLGYGYTHTVSTRLKPKMQVLVHGIVLLIPFAFLLPSPFNLTTFTPPTGGNPMFATLGILAAVVGIPFLVVATSAPLLQKWFTYTGHPAAKDPYFLYGASNLGSLLGLAFYPIVEEPLFALRTQAWIWLGIYLALAALIGLCIALIWRPVSSGAADHVDDAPAAPTEPNTAIASGAPVQKTAITRKKGIRLAAGDVASEAESTPDVRGTDTVSWARRIRWILLATVPSSLMLGVTTYISTDLSPFPMLWAIPLALYLISFILVYMKAPFEWTSRNPSDFTPHSLVLWLFEPLGIIVMCFLLMPGTGFKAWGVLAVFAGFMSVALACHGELAKDRPSTRHLTEYFLWLSVGGMLGGVFNAIIAPLIFTGVWEFPITLALACLARPILADSGWFEGLLYSAFPNLEGWARERSNEYEKSTGKTPSNRTFVLNYGVDILLGLFMLGFAVFMSTTLVNWGGTSRDDNVLYRIVRLFFDKNSAPVWLDPARKIVMYLIPLAICYFFNHRPLRFALGIAAFLFANLYIASDRDSTTLYAGRSYFGVLRVLEDREFPRNVEEAEQLGILEKGPDGRPRYKDGFDGYKYTYLMHGTTYHGRNYLPHPVAADVSRLATTYYHRYGPVGVAMERANWFPGQQNTYWADVRMPASEIGHLVGATSTLTNLPMGACVNLFSDTPFATIGLGTGTMASYGRPFQHVVYYEIDEKIRDCSLPPTGKRTLFTFLENAVGRGTGIEVIMGDARLSMAQEDPKNSTMYLWNGKDEPYVRMPEGKFSHSREKYYKCIVVDAFSSDAIPIHLLTKQAMELYLSKLTDDGVLCVHTSNRHMDLVKPVGAIVKDIYDNSKEPRAQRWFAMEGQETAEREGYLGHFSSQYVMVYRKKFVDPITGQEADNPVASYFDPRAQQRRPEQSKVRWTPATEGNSVFTDDYSNILEIIRLH